MNRRPTRRTRSGCSGLGALIFLLLIIGAIIGWPIYIQTHGITASGVITEKQESVRISYGEWYRRFEVIASYSTPGQLVQHRAACDVDESARLELLHKAVNNASRSRRSTDEFLGHHDFRTF